MKPAMLLQKFDPTGTLNEPATARKRLEKAAYWKKQRVIVVTPTAEMIHVKVYLAHLGLIFPPNNAVARIPAVGLEVGEAYSTVIEQILAHPELSQWEYILTLESDNCPPQDGVLRLIERMEERPDLDCIGGLYYTKGDGGSPQIWGDPNDALNFRPQLPDPAGGLVECTGTGMGFNLWRLKMFKNKKLRKPWFKTQTHGGVATQDLYFWMDAKKHGFKCAVDCSVRVGHYDALSDTMY